MTVSAQSPAPSHSWLTPLREDATRLIKAATADDFAWQRLAELTDTYGHRLSGSENLARAVDWAVRTMKADGLENVRTERVMVPHWVRGRETAEIVDPPRHQVPILGLGGTVPTPPGGLEAEVLVVSSFDDLRVKGAEAKNRIVLFNVPYNGYSETVTYRNGGARSAAQYGAVAVLVRSVGPLGLRTTHTGSVNYAPGQPQIPAAAISIEDANRIARLSARGRTVRMRLTLESRTEPDAESANVVGEIRGREKPHEIVLLAGHLDSWDVGTGASDDGVGCIVTWEALRLMKKLGIRPRRTVRIVLFANEENGLRGAAAYVREACRDRARSRVRAGVGLWSVCPGGAGFLRQRGGALDDAADRQPAGAARLSRHHRRRRRGRHRSDRAGRQRADDGVSGRSGALLRHPPQRGGYRRANRT